MKHSHASLLWALIIIQLLLNLFLWSTLYWRDASTVSEHDSLQQSIFQGVINDAAKVSDERIVRTLFPLNEANQQLVWRDQGDEPMVKVLAWMSEESYQQHYAGKDVILTPPETIASVWVTLFPQVQHFCRSVSKDQPAFRLKQYLGLDPNRTYERFVEFWVRPEDVFRPCVDPEPTDNVCQLEWHEDDNPKVKNIADYKAFFARLKVKSYAPDGAPWTRLGYTYDWNNGQRGVGASEYIIVPGAEIIYAGSFPTSAYCAEK